MIFIEEGLNLRWLACIYAFLGIAASFGVGNMAQVNSISTAMKTAFNIPPIYTGVMISLFVGITVMGGVKAIASITEKLVPFMSVFYILAALIVIAFHFNNIPYAFNVIFTGAFKPLSPVGGFVGATVATAVQKGISRGIFTNEAGLGSASIAHAAADTDHPARQGLWGIFEVFFDTIVMCSITAIAILASGVWTNGQTGTDLTVTAFDTVLNGLGKYFIAISIAVFAFMTLLAWSFYGKKCMEYLAGEEYNKYYITLYLLAIIAGSVLELHLVWEISDVLNGLMAIPNMIGLIFLSKVVIQLAKEGKKKMNL